MSEREDDGGQFPNGSVAEAEEADADLATSHTSLKSCRTGTK